MIELERAAKARPRQELLLRLIQPLATAGVGVLARWGVNPLAVVMTHSILGFFAAWLLALQMPSLFVPAALLLQAKTLLDNMDGGLARATGQVTRMGRYFDTVMDFLVNIALFAALANYGPPLGALAAFLILMVLLSLDFNLERLYREARLEPTSERAEPIGAPRSIYLVFKGIYDAILSPQDRLIAGADAWLFQRLSGLAYHKAPLEPRLAWSDLFSTAALVNLGLSTQLFVFGLCLVIGQPYWYVYSIFVEGFYALCVLLLRVLRFRRYLRRVENRV